MNNREKIIKVERQDSSAKQKSEILQLPKVDDLEAIVLGAMVFEGLQKVEDAIDVFREDNPFYSTDNRRLYELIREMFANEETIDIETVAIKANAKGLSQWGGYQLMTLTKDIIHTAHFAAHCYIIFEKYIARTAIESLSTAIGKAYREDIFEALQFAEEEIFKLTIGKINSDFVGTSSAVDKVMANIISMRDKNETVTGIPSGYPSLDRITGGWQNSDLIILAAPSGLGKTAFALNLAYNAAMLGRPVGIFSIEMSTPQLIKRLLAIDSGVSLDFIGRADLTDDQLEKVAISGKRIAALPIYIDDSDSLTVFDFRAKVRKMISKHKIEIAFVDYLQIMDSKGQNREREVALISGGLKKTAKSVNIPVIALSQLNESGEVRESKAIENDANILMKLSRPNYKKKKEDRDPSVEFDAELEIVKFRDGEAGLTIPFEAYLFKQKFVDPASDTSFPDTAFGNTTEIINPYKTFQNRLPFSDKDHDAPF